MVTKIIFLILVILVALQRIYELSISKKHEKIIRAQGGFEYAPSHFIFMKLIHVFWLIFIILEVFLFDREFYFSLAIISFAFFLLGQILRILAIRTLKNRWTVTIMVIPNSDSISTGIFKYIRHPNYLGVILEIFFLPLVHTAYLSCFIFSVLNLIILYIRINKEEEILRKTSISYFGSNSAV